MNEAECEVERVWQEFWRPLVVDERGIASLKLIKRDLYDYWAIMGEVSKVYDAVTGGMISKPNACAEVVIAEFEDRLSRLIAEGVEDELEALDTEQDSGDAVPTVGLEEGGAEEVHTAGGA